VSPGKPPVSLRDRNFAALPGLIGIDRLSIDKIAGRPD
jgi:hypothetical protein